MKIFFIIIHFIVPNIKRFDFNLFKMFYCFKSQFIVSLNVFYVVKNAEMFVFDLFFYLIVGHYHPCQCNCDKFCLNI